MLFFSLCGCELINDNTEYTIRGQLLQSCDNPTPVSGVKLILDYDCNCNSSKILQEIYTDADGKFEFKYKSVNGNDIVIRGNQANGLGTINYLFGIPINKDLDVGNLYSSNNFFAVLKIVNKRQSTKNDTIFYDVYGSANFRRFIVGPFIENQILDTIMFRNTQFFDKVNDNRIYKNNGFASYNYKIGQKGREVYADGSHFIVCTKYNEYILEVK
jgi:hypothetical protein